MHKRSKLVLILSFLAIFLLQTLDVEAQRRRRTSTRDQEPKEELSFKERLTHGIHMGNVNLFGNIFTASAKYTLGYRASERLSAGFGVKGFFDLDGRLNPDVSGFSYGTGPYTRFKVMDQFFLQAEYNISSYKDVFSNAQRQSYAYPLVGGGYLSNSGGPWSGGINVLFILSEEVRDLGNKDFVEWWFTFFYNF